MKIVFTGFNVVDSTQEAIVDILVEDGKIIEIGENLKAERTIEGHGLTLMPAFSDLHVHFREPGYEYKETIETGSLAALKGGFTGVNAMANTNPICDTQETLDYILNKGKETLIDLDQVVAITKGFLGEDLSHLDTMQRIKFISDDGHGVQSDLVMYQAMLKAKEKGYGLMLHEEQAQFSSFDYRIAEDLMTIRDVYLAGATNARVHFCHVSTKASVEAIRNGKALGYSITCEVSPHHLVLKDCSYKVNPPIRTQEDIDALIQGIKDGTVDAIATDHAPHSQKDKENGSPGLIGLETSFSICYEALVKTKIIPLTRLVQLLSTNPNQILGYKKGKIDVGYQADFAIADLNTRYVFDTHEIRSKSCNSPFIGHTYSAKIIATYRKGRKVYEDHR